MQLFHGDKVWNAMPGAWIGHPPSVSWCIHAPSPSIHCSHERASSRCVFLYTTLDRHRVWQTEAVDSLPCGRTQLQWAPWTVHRSGWRCRASCRGLGPRHGSGRGNPPPAHGPPAIPCQQLKSTVEKTWQPAGDLPTMVHPILHQSTRATSK